MRAPEHELLRLLRRKSARRGFDPKSVATTSVRCVSRYLGVVDKWGSDFRFDLDRSMYRFSEVTASMMPINVG